MNLFTRQFIYKKKTYFGAGSPSASHSTINGLSFSLACWATWKSNSSVGGCLMIRGGEWTIEKRWKRCVIGVRNDRGEIESSLKYEHYDVNVPLPTLGIHYLHKIWF